jgi:hypothetical protein
MDFKNRNFQRAPTLRAGKNFSKFFNEKSLVSRRMGASLVDFSKI